MHSMSHPLLWPMETNSFRSLLFREETEASSGARGFQVWVKLCAQLMGWPGRDQGAARVGLRCRRLVVKGARSGVRLPGFESQIHS